MPPYSDWLYLLSRAYLIFCVGCAAWIVLHEFVWPQKMAIMNIVWPITALYAGPLALWAYVRSGSKMTRVQMAIQQREAEAEVQRSSVSRTTGQSSPTREQIAVAVSHCGAGCALGDIVGEWWVFAMVLSWAGGEFLTRLVLDFILAWLFGILFQYFTIAPMRGLSFGKGVRQAIRADTLSIVAFQVGMFGWMALTYYVFFPSPHLRVNEAVFWFMMQIGMMAGFVTSYPANVFLLKQGWKEKMPQYKHEMERKIVDEKKKQSQPKKLRAA
jgi:hypothetical protein